MNSASSMSSELGRKHGIRKERGANIVLPLNVILPGFSRMKIKHYYAILQMRNLDLGIKGLRDLPNAVRDGEGWI